ncbi:MAG: ABC transporter permease [Deltaproteobacteria bacterium]|nr:ABC transporter permease [Deltaproteobacteria bacterium]TLN04926.1 MAG: ABC transporter permease [bacterium]
MKLRVVGANLFVKLMSVYREKTTMFFTLAFPIILILVFGTIFMSQDNVNFHLAVQDLDQSKASKDSIEALEVNGKFKITRVDPAANPVQYVRDHGVTVVLVIPKGLEKSLQRRKFFNDYKASATVTYVYDPSSSSVGTKIDILNGVLAGVNQELAGIPPFIKSVKKSILTRKYRFIEFFIPGIIAMAVMTLSLFGTVNVNTELRQKGIIRKLSTTPITRIDWILSDILYQYILAVISTTAMLLVSYAVFDANLHINAWLPAFILLNVFAFVGIGMILTRFAREAQSAAAAANAISFPMMFLSGSFFPIELMPGFLQTIAKMLPLYYVNEGLRAAMVFQDNLDALRNAAIIGVFASVVFILGILATKWEEST